MDFLLESCNMKDEAKTKLESEIQIESKNLITTLLKLADMAFFTAERELEKNVHTLNFFRLFFFVRGK